jgi:hypothetical protein
MMATGGQAVNGFIRKLPHDSLRSNRLACPGSGVLLAFGLCYISTPAETSTLERTFRGLINQAHGLTEALPEYCRGRTAAGTQGYGIADCGGSTAKLDTWRILERE